jgi:hypothetical protein
MGSAAIPLGYKPPQLDQYSATDALKQRMGLQAMAQAAQLNDAKIQEERLKTQALEEDRRDNDAIRQGYSLYPGDLKKVRDHIASKVNPRNLQAFDKSVQEHAAALAKMDSDQITVNRERAEQLARHLDAVSAVKRGDNSPEAVTARAAEWAKQVTLAKGKGFDPDNQIPAEYPGDEALPVLDTQLRGGAKHLADEEARRKAEATALDVKEKGNKIASEQLTEAAGILAAAAERGPAEYIKERAKIEDPKLRARFADPPEDAQPLTPLDTDFVENVRSIGLKAHEQATVTSTKALRQETAQRDAETALWRGATADERERHDRVSEEIQRTRAARERGQTANSHAVDLRGWQRELAKVKEEEDDIATTRANLENVIASGGKIDEKGKPVKVASDDDKAAAAALVERSRSQYESLTKKLKRVTADKNDLGELLGQEIGVKTSDVHRALDADLKRVGAIGKPTDKPNPPAAAPPAQAKPAPQAQAAPRQGQRFSNGKVTVMWNGKQYIDEATGKPAQF